MLRRSVFSLLRLTPLCLQGWGSSSSSSSSSGGWGSAKDDEDGNGDDGWGSGSSDSGNNKGNRDREENDNEDGWGSSGKGWGGGSDGGSNNKSRGNRTGRGGNSGFGGNNGGNGGGWGESNTTSSWGSASSSNNSGGGGWGSRDRRGGGGGGGRGSSRWGSNDDEFNDNNGGGGGWGSNSSNSNNRDRSSRGFGRGRGGRGGDHESRFGFGRGQSFSSRNKTWGNNENDRGGSHRDSEEGMSQDAWSAAPPSFTPPIRRIDPLTLTAVEVEIDGVRKLVGQRVQITGLSDDTTWHTLKDHLRQVAEVTFCRIYSGGRAMVEFTTPEDAARAITELQASELEGATLFLREDRDDTVLVNTRRKIREARELQLRTRKEEAEKLRREKAIAQGDHVDNDGSDKGKVTSPSHDGDSIINNDTTSTNDTKMEQSADTKTSNDHANERSTSEATETDRNDCSLDSVKKVATATATD